MQRSHSCDVGSPDLDAVPVKVSSGAGVYSVVRVSVRSNRVNVGVWQRIVRRPIGLQNRLALRRAPHGRKPEFAAQAIENPGMRSRLSAGISALIP